jgi:hypothetical protein
MYWIIILESNDIVTTNNRTTPEQPLNFLKYKNCLLFLVKYSRDNKSCQVFSLKTGPLLVGQEDGTSNTYIVRYCTVLIVMSV